MDGLFGQLVLVALVAGVLLYTFHQLRLGPIVALLVSGVLLGPQVLGVLDDPILIDRMAEVGIVLLMFSIGLDFTPDRTTEFRRSSVVGFAQISICIGVTAGVALIVVDHLVEAILLGFMIAHTSSTLMLKLFLDRGELESPHVRLGLGISITQDLAAVPMLLIIPMMAGMGGDAGSFGLVVLKAMGLLVIALAIGRWIVPRLLHTIMGTRNRELFLLVQLIICFGAAWAAVGVGLSAALGGFLAGLMVARSTYSHQILAEVAPFRDLLVSLFFISIGMLLDLTTLGTFALPVLACVGAILMLKFLSAFVPVLIWGYPLRTATLVGLGIAQIGEFSFVLARTGQGVGLITDELFQFFVLVAIVTMALNPFLIDRGPSIAQLLSRVRWLRRIEDQGTVLERVEDSVRESHVVVAGYGLNGRNLAQALDTLTMSHVVIDLNPQVVQLARQRGEVVIFGDCTRSEVLRKARVDHARVFVVAISDPRATRQSVRAARHLNAELHIIVRTKYLSEIDILRRLGANEVIAEEFETSLEVLARTLACYELPASRIEEVITQLRGNAYYTLRGIARFPQHSELIDSRTLKPSELTIETISIASASSLVGCRLHELDLTGRTRATLVARLHEGRLESSPDQGTRIHAGDILVIAGTPEQIASVVTMIDSAVDSSPNTISDTSHGGGK